MFNSQIQHYDLWPIWMLKTDTCSLANYQHIGLLLKALAQWLGGGVEKVRGKFPPKHSTQFFHWKTWMFEGVLGEKTNSNEICCLEWDKVSILWMYAKCIPASRSMPELHEGNMQGYSCGTFDLIVLLRLTFSSLPQTSMTHVSTDWVSSCLLPYPAHRGERSEGGGRNCRNASEESSESLSEIWALSN